MKNIFAILLLFTCLVVSGQQVPGTKVTSPIVPNDLRDDYPTHVDIYGQGGYRSVQTKAERDAIKESRKSIGMLVYVSELDSTYILKAGKWQAYGSGNVRPAGKDGSVQIKDGDELAGTDLTVNTGFILPLNPSDGDPVGLTNGFAGQISTIRATPNGMSVMESTNSKKGLTSHIIVSSLDTDQSIVWYAKSDAGTANLHMDTINITHQSRNPDYWNYRSSLLDTTFYVNKRIKVGNQSITASKMSDWNAAYAWGNHSSAGYLKSFTETDPTIPSHVKSITSANITNWNAAYGWGNHASAGYLKSVTETDPVWSAVSTNYYTKTNLQTSGQAQVHWGNVTNKVNAARGTAGLIALPSGTTTTRYLREDGTWQAISSGGITEESDPTVPDHVKSITSTNITNWNNAYTNRHTHNNKTVLDAITSAKTASWDDAFGWGDHSSAGYLKSFTETDPTIPSHVKSITSANITNWNAAYGWGNHASAGYLKSITETDPVWSAASTNYYTKTNLQTSGQAQVHWGNVTNKVNAARGTAGLLALPSGTTTTRYLREDGTWQAISSGGITEESDPTVPDHVKSITSTNITSWNTASTNSHTHSNKTVLDGITSVKTGNWDLAYGWGDHSVAGYLKSFTETDPTVPSHVKSITSANITNWNTAYTNNHAHTNKTVLDAITSAKTGNWDAAYGWGNHASAGYLKSVTETDPVWTAASTNYYTKTNLQTSGQAQVHWGNVTNKVNAARGTAGLIALPSGTTTTRYLREDGTWQTIEAGSSINVVQRTGSSTTDVISQKGVTDLLFYGEDLNKVTIGNVGSEAVGSMSVAIGGGGSVKAQGQAAVALGTSSEASGNYTIGIKGAASGNQAISIGMFSQAEGANSVALGSSARTTTSEPNTVSFGQTGSSTYKKRLINLSPGVDANDAATISQLDLHGKIYVQSTQPSVPTNSFAFWIEGTTVWLIISLPTGGQYKIKLQ